MTDTTGDDSGAFRFRPGGSRTEALDEIALRYSQWRTRIIAIIFSSGSDVEQFSDAFRRTGDD